MSIPTKALSTIVDRGLAVIRTQLPTWPLGTKKFLGRLTRGVALQIWGLQKSVEDVDLDIVPSQQSSTDALGDWAFNLGLPDGQGGFGRLLPTLASGGASTITGVKGTVFPDGATATAEDGTTQIELSGSVTIPGSGTGYGSVAAVFVAITEGADGNLAEGTVCTWDSPPGGADAQFTLTGALQGGYDLETNPAVFARIVQRLQTPPRGGAAADYRLWAQDGATGITEVFIYNRRHGTGSVDVVCVTAGNEQDCRPSVAQLADASAEILLRRPAGVNQVNVYAPHMPDATGHVVRMRVVPSKSDYDFDWDDTAATYLVDAYTPPGANAELELDGFAPASLKAAIDAYNSGTGSQPRLQVISTGKTLNPLVGVIDYTDGGSTTTLTLDTLPSNWEAPTVGDRVFAGGPVVETIAEGLRALANALGPSRVSGYADPLTVWFDSLTISGLIGVAEAAIDTDGTELIQRVPVGYATIDGAALDITPTDNTTNPPVKLYLESIAVTQ